MKTIIAFVASLMTSLASAQTVSFTPLLEIHKPCKTSHHITTGGQYVDPNNGVIDDAHTLLVRWQGEAAAKRVEFLNCNYASVLINSWSFPRIPVIGGGYNDMYGYSFGTAPAAFNEPDGHEADLIVQADIGVWSWTPYWGKRARHMDPVMQIAMFAYLVDKSQPHLKPIAIIGLTHDTRNHGPYHSVSKDYPEGVFFSSALINASSPYNTADPHSARFRQIWKCMPEFSEFFRMRISPENWRNTIRDINKIGGTYSTDVKNYGVKYAGVIFEATLWDGEADGSLADPDRDQFIFKGSAQNLGIYRRVAR